MATAASGLALGGCRLPAFGAFHPLDQQARNSYVLWSVLVIAAFAVGIFVVSLILWSVFRYRARPHERGAIPKQTHENIPWEIAYTLTPILIVAVIFGFTYVVENQVDAVPASAPVKVHVVAYRWGWIFDYQGSGVSVHTTLSHYPQLVLPEGRTTAITLTSQDVVHEFNVPQFLFERYAQPGITNHFAFTPTKTGTFLGHCGFYCGLYHTQMLFSVKIVTPSAFDSWLAAQRRAAGRSTGATTVAKVQA